MNFFPCPGLPTTEHCWRGAVCMIGGVGEQGLRLRFNTPEQREGNPVDLMDRFEPDFQGSPDKRLSLLEVLR